ncbi:MAG TPA: hypothetical protein VJA47_03565 [archaeon]|nr:hypothetical protein [archaeon]
MEITNQEEQVQILTFGFIFTMAILLILIAVLFFFFWSHGISGNPTNITPSFSTLVPPSP